jgi:dTMP kinase
MNGLFISFEGIDGAGKSTHIDRLAQCFRDMGRQVTLTREPGGTPLAERLRQMVLNDPMDAMTEALLVFAARRDHVQNVIVPSLLAGQVVLCDRFTDATFAYQGQGRSFDLAILNTLEQWVQGTGLDAALPQGLLQPALTVWFDLPAQVAAQRLATARVPDKFEAQPRAFFEQVSQGYAMRCAAAPQRFERINANHPLESVWTDVEAALRGRGLLR